MFLQHLAAVARFSGNGAHFTLFANQEMVFSHMGEPNIFT
jgi:hypothetical protein